MTEQNNENQEGQRSVGMLNTEKDVLVGEELKLVSVEKGQVKRDGEDVEFYVFYATRVSDGVMVSFFGSSVLNSQYDLGQLKPDMHFTIDKVKSRAGNTYYKAIILHRASE